MAEVTQSVFEEAWTRRSQEDLKRILDMLQEDGSITIVPDPPEEPEAPPEGGNGGNGGDEQ